LCRDRSLKEKEQAIFVTNTHLFLPLSAEMDAPNTLHWLQSLRYLIDHHTQVTGRYDGATQAFIHALKISCNFEANTTSTPLSEARINHTLWREIFLAGLIAVNQVAPLFLTNAMIQQIAENEALEPAIIKAIIEVEAINGSGFYENKHPVILFEGHIFWQELQKVGIDPQLLQRDNKDIIYPQWTNQHYGSTVADEFERLRRAQVIHSDAALRSAAWGMFQIMGFNHASCGYEQVQDFVNSMYTSEYEHLNAFIHFLHTEHIYASLKAKDWKHFSRAYKGAAYKKTAYDQRLAAAYEKQQALHNTSASITAVTEAAVNRTIAPKSLAPKVLQVANSTELQAALSALAAGDTLVLTQSGHYGQIRLTNKHSIRVKAANRDLLINGSVWVDGNSDNIRIEGLNIYPDKTVPYIIFSGPDCDNISISYNLVSSQATGYTSFNQRFVGQPSKWMSGIRVLGNNCRIFNNKVVNTRLAIVAQGVGTIVEQNLVRFFSEDGIRIQNHAIRVEANQIDDAVMADPNKPAHQDAIQLIPPEDRFAGGELRDIQIINNRIKNLSDNSSITPTYAAVLQGIFGSDGYFVNPIIQGNTVITNADHGITLNGVNNLVLENNYIYKASNTKVGFNPGIKLYLTRIGGWRSQWERNLAYSVRYLGNHANIFNLPKIAYESTDMGNNVFTQVTHDSGR
jgi:hypothetical protein